MTKKIGIITENFYIPWKPDDIDNFVAGSQESVIFLAEELVKNGYTVVVFSHGPVKTETVKRKEVLYTDLIDTNYEFFDTLILFKVNPFKILPKTNLIYWSADTEIVNNISKRVCLTRFHAQMNDWKDAYVIPLGVNIKSLNENKTEKDENIVLYSSCPNRGLKTLIQDWTRIKSFFPNLKLYVTYGFQILKQITTNLQIAENSQKYLQELCEKLDITFLPNLKRNDFEKLYWKAKYWILPLNQAKSELFCLNAVKAQYCGCIPIVNKIGALTETVGDYIEYKDFCNGSLAITKGDNKVPLFEWNEVVKEWEKLF